MGKISSDWCIRQCNARRSLLHRRIFNLQAKKKKPGRKPRKKPQCENKKGGGGGGAMRAFMHDQLLQHGPQKKTNTSQLFTSIHRKFRALTSEQLEHYKQLGEAATLASSTGHRPFGQKRFLRMGSGVNRALQVKQNQRPTMNRKRKRCGASLVPVQGASEFTPGALAKMRELSAVIASKRQRLAQARESEAQQNATKEQTLRECVRATLNYAGPDDPMVEEEHLDHMIAESALPHATQIPNCSCWELFPLNAKIAKERFGRAVLLLCYSFTAVNCSCYGYGYGYTPHVTHPKTYIIYPCHTCPYVIIVTLQICKALFHVIKPPVFLIFSFKFQDSRLKYRLVASPVPGHAFSRKWSSRTTGAVLDSQA